MSDPPLIQSSPFPNSKALFSMPTPLLSVLRLRVGVVPAPPLLRFLLQFTPHPSPCINVPLKYLRALKGLLPQIIPPPFRSKVHYLSAFVVHPLLWVHHQSMQRE